MVVQLLNRLVTKQHNDAPVAAGLAVVAADTGRVLMIQRPLNGDDPNGGKWEFPGGRIEEGEKPFAAAWREWLEETGLPTNGGIDANIAIDAYGNQWTSSNGKYAGFVAHVPSENLFDLNDRNLSSDPDSDVGGVLAWVHPRDLPQHNLRPTLLSDVDEVLAAVTKWLLMRQMRKSGPVNRLNVFCSTGKGGGVDLACGDVELEKKGTGGSFQSAGRWLAEKWEQLEGRYDRKAALARVVAMIGTLPVPGNIPAAIAVAEGVRGICGYFQQEYGGDIEKLKKFGLGENQEDEGVVEEGTEATKGETVMDLDPELTLRFPVNRLRLSPRDEELK